MFDTVCRRRPEQRFLWVAPTASTAQTPMMVWGRSNRSCRPSKLLLGGYNARLPNPAAVRGCLQLTKHLLGIVVSGAPSRPGCVYRVTLPKTQRPLPTKLLQRFFLDLGWLTTPRRFLLAPTSSVFSLTPPPISLGGSRRSYPTLDDRPLAEPRNRGLNAMQSVREQCPSKSPSRWMIAAGSTLV